MPAISGGVAVNVSSSSGTRIYPSVTADDDAARVSAAAERRNEDAFADRNGVDDDEFSNGCSVPGQQQQPSSTSSSSWPSPPRLQLDPAAEAAAKRALLEVILARQAKLANDSDATAKRKAAEEREAAAERERERERERAEREEQEAAARERHRRAQAEQQAEQEQAQLATQQLVAAEVAEQVAAIRREDEAKKAAEWQAEAEAVRRAQAVAEEEARRRAAYEIGWVDVGGAGVVGVCVALERWCWRCW